MLGSIPTSVWVGTLFFGIDIRTRGSGNAGGTNTLRTLGWRAGVAVIVVDVSKGAAAVMLARLAPAPEWLPVACMVAAMLGHSFPVFAGFRGGKGIATGAGSLVVLAPPVVLACGLLWAAVVATARIVSVASLVAALSLPLAVSLLAPSVPALLPVSYLLAAFVVWTHRDNLRRLGRGEEPRTTIARRG